MSDRAPFRLHHPDESGAGRLDLSLVSTNDLMNALLARCDQGAILLRYENRPTKGEVVVQRRFKYNASHLILGILSEAHTLLAVDHLAVEDEVNADGERLPELPEPPADGWER